jgi:hypothetical protein
MWVILGMTLSIVIYIGMIAPVNAEQKKNFPEVGTIADFAGIRQPPQNGAPTIPIPGRAAANIASNPPGDPANPEVLGTLSLIKPAPNDENIDSLDSAISNSSVRTVEVPDLGTVVSRNP